MLYLFWAVKSLDKEESLICRATCTEIPNNNFVDVCRNYLTYVSGSAFRERGIDGIINAVKNPESIFPTHNLSELFAGQPVTGAGFWCN